MISKLCHSCHTDNMGDISFSPSYNFRPIYVGCERRICAIEREAQTMDPSFAQSSIDFAYDRSLQVIRAYIILNRNIYSK